MGVEEMWLRTWLLGDGGDGLMVRLGDLSGLSNLHNSMLPYSLSILHPLCTTKFYLQLGELAD